MYFKLNAECCVILGAIQGLCNPLCEFSPKTTVLRVDAEQGDTSHAQLLNLPHDLADAVEAGQVHHNANLAQRNAKKVNFC